MKRWTLRTAALLVAAAMIGSADGATAAQAPPDPCDLGARHADTALAEVRVPVPAGWAIVHRCGADGDLGGYTRHTDRTITLWVEQLPPWYMQWAIIHELGHVYAASERMDRQAWRTVRGMPDDLPWNVDQGGLSREQWLLLPVEDFAESFAYCQLPDMQWVWQSGLGGPPTVEQCMVIEYLTGVPSRL